MDQSPLVFPQPKDRARIDQYRHYDKLFYGEHYEAFAIKSGGDFAKQYKKLRYIAANFAGLISKVMSDMLFGEAFTLGLNDEANQTFADGLLHENDVMNQLAESALGNSRRGDDVWKIRIGKRNPLVRDAQPEIIVEQVGPSIYFPTFDNTAARNVTTQDAIITQFKSGGGDFLHKEIHQPGFIYHQVYRYSPNEHKIIAEVDPKQYGYQEEEQTRINRSLVFHIPNYRDAKEFGGFWGTSDYVDLESLFFALNNRLTKTDNILDKHSDPILAVPPGVIDEEGNVKKEALGLFEVDNENPGFNKPEYIVWNANLESAFKEVDKILDLLFMLSEIAPATFGMDKDGEAESGRALKFKLLATIRKRNRKLSQYDKFIKDMVRTSMELSNAWGIKIDGQTAKDPERPTIIWPDGIVNDVVEQVEVADKRINAGVSSRADEIARLDGKTLEEAREKVQEIDEERDPALLPISNGLNGDAGQNNQEE